MMRSRPVKPFALTLIFALLASLLASGQPAAAQTGPQPGPTDPMGKPSRYYLLRSDEVFAPGVPAASAGNSTPNFVDYTYFLDASLNVSSTLTQGTSDRPDYEAGYDPQMWAASGRVLTSTHDQIVYARRTYVPGGWFGVFLMDQGIQQPTPSYYLSGLAPRLEGYTDFLGLAVGDLDKIADEDGVNHDEVVVAYASSAPNGNWQINVVVLNYTSVCGGGTSQIQPCGLTTAQVSNVMRLNGMSPDPDTGAMPMAVAIGDFDGDPNGLQEIAVVHIQDWQNAWVTSFRYTNDGKNVPSLKQINALQFGPGSVISVNNTAQFAGSLSVAAGDFNGDDIDELAVGFPNYAFDTPTSDDLRAQANVCLFTSDSNLVFSQGSPCWAPNVEVRNQRRLPVMNVQLAAGLFRFDPPNGFDFGRRQLAMAWNTPDPASLASDGNIYVWVFSLSWDVVNNQPANVDPTDIVSPYALTDSGTDRFSVAAGGLRGLQAPGNPLWSVALSYITPPDSSNPGGVATFSTFDVAAGSPVAFAQPANQGYWSDGRMPLVAYDYNGDSLYLGAPVHISFEDAVIMDYILQEPPKHAYYDSVPNAANSNTPTYQIINVSRYDQFNINMVDSSSTTLSSQSTDTTDWSIGGSTSASASASAKEGDDLGSLVGAELEVTESFSASASYDYSEHEQSYNAQSKTRTFTFVAETDSDDALQYRKQAFDVWRYRVYGLTISGTQNNIQNGFYDIVFPHPVTETVQTDGQCCDWYQPIHENGNILSYPQLVNQSFTPSDLGPYTNLTGTQTVTIAFLTGYVETFDGNGGSFNLSWTDTTGSGSSRSYTHKLAESADFSLSVKATADDFVEGASVTVAGSVSFNNSNSWGKVETSNQTTNQSTGITLNKYAGIDEQGYTYAPVIYITQDGALKAAHAVDVLGYDDGSEFWRDVYGAYPDPAVNLPARFSRFTAENGTTQWKPNPYSSRKQMRGLFFLSDTLNPVTGAYDPLAYTPESGDSPQAGSGQKVRIEARVYNYSVGQQLQNLPVAFQVIPYDDKSDTEDPFKTTTCPNGQAVTAQGRCPIGQTTIATLAPLQPMGVTTATVTWDTTGFGPSVAGASQDYRVYVVLDPNNAIDEIYETEDPNATYPFVDYDGNKSQYKGIDPGQNNEGHGVLTITAPQSNATNRTTPRSRFFPQSRSGGSDRAEGSGTFQESERGSRDEQLSNGPGANAYLVSDSIAIQDTRDGALRTADGQALLFERARLRLKVYSDKAHREYAHVLLYDGDPAQGGKLIADKIMHSGDPDGAHAWVDWIPKQPGRHELFARVLKDRDDPVTDNGVDTMVVMVARQQIYFPFLPLASLVHPR